MKILAIDDNKDNLVLMKAEISILFPNADFISAQSGIEGIELTQSEQPDIILLDLVMPEMDGYETCKRLKKNILTKHIPVIIITANKEDKTSRTTALGIGADAFLSKPVEETELRVQIQAMNRIKVSEDALRSEKKSLEKLVEDRTKELENELTERKTIENDLRSTFVELEKSQKASLNLMEDLKEEISERKEKEFQLAKMNRLYLLSSKGNESLLKIDNSDVLFKELCHIAVEFGNFQMAWVGIIDETNSKINVVSSDGLTGNYIKNLELQLDEVEKSNGPAGLAIRTGKPSVINNILTDTKMKPWRNASNLNGYNSVACFPLFVFNKVFGVFTLYSNEINYFDKEEINLLNELSQDISFALEFAKTKEEKIKSDKTQAVIHSIVKDSINTTSIEDLIGKIHNHLSELIKVENFYVALYNPKNNLYSFPYFVDQTEFVSNIKNFSLENSLTDYVRRTGKPIIVDKKMHNLLEQKGEAKLVGIPSSIWIGVPLKSKETVFGVLAVQDYNNPNAYSSDDLELLNFVSKQIALVIDWKQNEEFLRFVEFSIDNSSDEIFWITSDARIVNTNNSACKQLGYTKEELLTLTVMDIEHNYPIETWSKHWVDSRKKKSSFFESVHRRKDGSTFPVDISISHIEFGNKEYHCVFAKDITERKKIEIELRESEEKFRKMFHTSPDSVNINRLEDGLYIEINDEFTAVSGFTREDVIGKTSAEINIWVNQKDMVRLVKGLQKYGEVLNLEAEFRKKDGSIAHGLISANVISINNEPHIISITRDYEEIYQSQKVIKESQLRYLLLFNSIRDSIIVTDKDRSIINCNTAFETQFGFKLKEILGEKASYIYENEEQFIELGDEIKNHFEDKTPFSYTVNYKKKDSTIFPGETSIFDLKDSNNNVSGFIGLIRDITERQKAELEIFKLSQVVEQSKVSIVITDLDGNIEYVNPYFSKITGYTKKEAIGQNPRVLKSGEQKNELYKEMWERISKGKIWNVEFHNKKKNGELYWEDVTITPLKDKNGNTINYCAIKTDITGRKAIEKELQEHRESLELLVQERTLKLRESEETFRAMAENTNDTIMRFDKEHRHLYVNKVVENQTGISANHFIGKTPKELGFSNDLIKIWGDAIDKVFKTKKEKRIEFQLPNKIWVDWQLVPELDKDKNVKAVIGSGRDITKIKDIEKELNIALLKEKEVNEMKTRFISTVSHEIRTPLTSIKSSAELLIRYGAKWNDVKKNEQLDRINHSVNYLVNLIEDVLTMSRTDTGKIIVNTSHVNIKETFKEIINNIKSINTNEQKLNLNFKVNMEGVTTDPKLLTIIVTNLLNNAIKYSGKGSEININVETNKFLNIEIVDFGIGIPSEGINLLFEPFYRAENAEKYKGSGLGLSIVKRAIDMLKGTISVESEINKGSKFKIILPIKY